MEDEQKGRRWNFGNKKILLGLGIIVVLLIVGAAVLLNKGTEEGSTVTANGEETSELTRRNLDGVFVEKGKENLYPIAVMLENLVTVRPQSGFSKANLVWEALAEGGITRFLAVYASGEEVVEIGPVRSARDYYLPWVKELDALYAHIGGSPQALRRIPEYEILDLSAMGQDSKYFWRDTKRKTAPEHTLFTSSQLLTYALRDKNLSPKESFEPWNFKDDVLKEERPEVSKNMTIDFSTFSYKVEYTYGREKNQYLRTNGGAPHEDALTKEQIAVKNVVVQFVPIRLADSTRLEMETIGEGDALVFQDGMATVARWKKPSLKERTRFYEKETGDEIAFNAGPTWIEVVPLDRKVEY